MKYVLTYSGVVALVILAIVGGINLANHKSAIFGTAVDCGAVTCFTTVGVLTSLQSDGTFIVNGVSTLASLIVSGNARAATLSVATTSSSQTVNVGAGGSATSTVDAGKPCFRFTMLLGQIPTVVYYWPTNVIAGAGAASGWATSTVSCF